MSEGIINPSKALARLAALDRKMAVATARFENDITAIKARMETVLHPMMEEDKAIRSALEAHFNSVRDEVFEGETKSLKFPHGVVGYRLNPPSLVVSKPKTLIKRLRDYFAFDADNYIKVTETPKKDVLKGLPPEDLKALGLKVVQEEEFYITLDNTAVENVAAGEEEAA